MQRQSTHLRLKGGSVLLFLLALAGGCLFLPSQAHAAVQATYYVSPTGSDNNSGTSITAPFATLDHARQVVETINGNMSGEIVVYLLGGTYSLNQTITFTPKDSGTNGHQILYEAYPGQIPVLSGGTPVTGWTQYSGGIYKAHLSRPDKLRSLYVNGHRAVMDSRTITSQGCWGTYAVRAGQASWAWVNGSQADGIEFNPSETDTGAIYTLGAQPGTVISNNYIDGIPNHGLPEGIHLDEGSAYITVNNSVINVASGTLAYSGNNCCEQHDLTITNTYATTGSIWTPIASNSREDAPMVYANANWPAAALSIIQSAGLEAAYQNLSPLYTADHASLAGGACLASDHAGYIGSGFVACFTAQGASATFTVNVDAAGTYTVLQRYANGLNPAAEAKTVSVYVNGSKSGQVSFPSTGDWNTWANQSLALALQAGANTGTNTNPTSFTLNGTACNIV